MAANRSGALGGGGCVCGARPSGHRLRRQEIHSRGLIARPSPQRRDWFPGLLPSQGSSPGAGGRLLAQTGSRRTSGGSSSAERIAASRCLPASNLGLNLGRNLPWKGDSLPAIERRARMHSEDADANQNRGDVAERRHRVKPEDPPDKTLPLPCGHTATRCRAPRRRTPRPLLGPRTLGGLSLSPRFFSARPWSPRRLSAFSS